MNVENIKLRYYVLLFLVVQFIITITSYLFFGKLESVLQQFDSQQTVFLLSIVSISNFFLILLGFTILAIILDVLLNRVTEYLGGYKRILKLLLIVSYFQIIQIDLIYLLNINIGSYSAKKVYLDICFKIFETLLFYLLARSNFEKKEVAVLVTSLIFLQIFSYIGMSFITQYFGQV